MALMRSPFRSMTGAIVTVLGLTLVAAVSRAQADNNSLIGLWISKTTWAAGPSGDLGLSRRGKSWRASIAGLETAFAASGPILKLEFPNHEGTFRGTMDKTGRNISGFWIQPHPGAGNPRDSDGTGMSFASPVTLTRRADGSWHGTVVPFHDTFTLYLKIFRDTGGTLIAAFRNPELNSRGGASQFGVAREGAAITFNGDQPDKRLSASLLGSDAIQIN